jgi:hypothetical protein
MAKRKQLPKNIVDCGQRAEGLRSESWHFLQELMKNATELMMGGGKTIFDMR